jgi:2,4-dienoyl-CoA reductase-like NADH-dependent reductase (Old Yellow Enzyme family)
LGKYDLSHRVVHAPMRRLRSDPDDTPSEMMAEYYSQRASEGGLVITESTHTLKSSRGYPGGPGIYEDHHIAGWNRIADAVHVKGGRVFMQITHDGRQSHVDMTGGALPVAPWCPTKGWRLRMTAGCRCRGGYRRNTCFDRSFPHKRRACAGIGRGWRRTS